MKLKITSVKIWELDSKESSEPFVTTGILLGLYTNHDPGIFWRYLEVSGIFRKF